MAERTPLSQSKKSLRTTVLGSLGQLTSEESKIQSELVLAKLLALDVWKASNAVCCFISMGPKEVDTAPILAEAFKTKKRCFVPRCVDKTQMLMLEAYDDVDIAGFPRTKWGIPEPPVDGKRTEAADCDDVSLVIVPGVAFDHVRRRLGHGRGYYDRYIARLRESRSKRGLPMPALVALGLGPQMVAEVPCSQWDQRVDSVLLPNAQITSGLPLDWCKRLPKIELHAHLSGSVREATVLELLREEYRRNKAHQAPVPLLTGESGPAPANAEPRAGIDSAAATAATADALALQLIEEQVEAEMQTFKLGDRNLEECFEVFSILHRLLDNAEAIARVTKEVVHDFAADGVIYLELRTTPRAVPGKLTKRAHIETIVSAIREAERTAEPKADLASGEAKREVAAGAEGTDSSSNKHGGSGGITVRLLLSVDRRGSLADALEAVDLATEFARPEAGGYVVGVDFSGNPLVRRFADFREAFELARSRGLRTTVHTAEVFNDADTDDIIRSFRPDRIGHTICLSSDATEYLRANPIPIEICPTSNLKTRCVPSLDLHPFGDFFKSDYPLSICTDDSGVFNISLSSEYQILSSVFCLTKAQLVGLTRRSVDLIFADECIKQQLRERMKAATSLMV